MLFCQARLLRSGSQKLWRPDEFEVGRRQYHRHDALRLGISIARVPVHNPESMAEFSVTLVQSCSRKLHLAFNLVHDPNLSLNPAISYDLYGRTVGIIGIGNVDRLLARILHSYNC